MRWIPIACWTLLLSVTPAQLSAQQMPRGDMAAATDSIIETYVVRLELTDEQESGIREILTVQGETARDMLETARAGGRSAMGEVRPKLQEMRRETDKQVEALLTEKQIPEYRKMREEADARRREHRRQRQPRN